MLSFEYVTNKTIKIRHFRGYFIVGFKIKYTNGMIILMIMLIDLSHSRI